MNSAHKGRRAEHRARALLEAAGFSVCRAARACCETPRRRSIQPRAQFRAQRRPTARPTRPPNPP